VKGRFWLLVAIVFFIIASARFASLGDALGATVFAVVALVFAVRLIIEIRRRKRSLGG
jgi:small basic protein